MCFNINNIFLDHKIAWDNFLIFLIYTRCVTHTQAICLLLWWDSNPGPAANEKKSATGDNAESRFDPQQSPFLRGRHKFDNNFCPRR